MDYLKKNKEETRFTVTSGAISICTAACDVVGAPVVRGVFRIGKASWLITPEIKNLAQTTGRWLSGKESFTEVKRDAAVMGITFGTYFISSVPMTRGSGKPKTVENQEQVEKQKVDLTENKIKTALIKGRDYIDQIQGLLKNKNENPVGIKTVFDIKNKKKCR